MLIFTFGKQQIIVIDYIKDVSVAGNVVLKQATSGGQEAWRNTAQQIEE